MRPAALTFGQNHGWSHCRIFLLVKKVRWSLGEWPLWGTQTYCWWWDHGLCRRFEELRAQKQCYRWTGSWRPQWTRCPHKVSGTPCPSARFELERSGRVRLGRVQHELTNQLAGLTYLEDLLYRLRAHLVDVVAPWCGACSRAGDYTWALLFEEVSVVDRHLVVGNSWTERLADKHLVKRQIWNWNRIYSSTDHSGLWYWPLDHLSSKSNLPSSDLDLSVPLVDNLTVRYSSTWSRYLLATKFI